MGLQAACNLAAFGVNTAVTFGLGTRGLLGARTNKAVSAEFPTLCTPAGWGFAIWGPIFLLEGGSMLWQFVAAKEDRAVLDSVSSAWCAACVLQASWTAAFSFDQMALSVTLLAGIPLALSSVYDTVTTRRSLSRSAASLVLGDLPFSLHYSWTTIASLVNVNLLAVKLQATPATQVALALASQLGAAGFGVAESWRRADPVPACVASWALLAIGANDGEAGRRIIASAPQLADRVDVLTSMAQVCGRGLGLFGAGVLAWNVLKRRPSSTAAKSS
jgi:hypothetical protein